MPKDSIRFRYKGKFVSETKARNISHLPHAKKFLTSEIVESKKAVKSYKKFIVPIERRLAKAFAADRKAIREKATRGKQAKERTRREQRIELKKRMDRAKSDTLAKEIALRAADEDISLEDAADAYADEIGSLDYYGGQDLLDTAES